MGTAKDISCPAAENRANPDAAPRDEADLRQLNAGLLAVARETLQPTHASCGLKPARTLLGTQEQDR
ncbi:MAG: hypothetical protein AVDCRST_MAG12-1387 [uncultured Rubrobacteraceae bacterium]|uniref:Uncharacterized protein n=1 Tax=uncultured Rubrobacteraceae bacterium TaxID=349277 RepID=A0A6J4RQ11_9ACTN|nr:MAG: hypothetical protein AVDCRST_MAG12-1387 [uncultured Rubrobacteraceae bacterium]